MNTKQLSAAIGKTKTMNTQDQQIIICARELIAAVDSHSVTSTIKLHELKLAVAAAIGVSDELVKTEL